MHYRQLFIAVLAAGLSTAWGAMPSLGETRLFSVLLKDCLVKDLKTWRHPVRSVLEKRGVQIEEVRLCNARKYPVFFVNFPYDPQGQTASYFSPLYDEMRIANGRHPFSFVALSDNTVVSVSYRPNGTAKVNHEMYKP